MIFDNDYSKDLPPEQRLCVSCGLCCDGTWFEDMILKGHEKAQAIHYRFQIFEEGNELKAKLPCKSLKSGCCTLFNEWRPQNCKGFKCALLRKLEANAISENEAMSLVREAVTVAEKLRSLVDSRPESISGLVFNNKLANTVQDDPEAMLDLAELRLLYKDHFWVKGN